MEVQELRAKGADELRSELSRLLKEQFSLRMLKGTGQLVTPHDLRRVRRNVARLRTILNEKARTERAQLDAAVIETEGETS